MRSELHRWGAALLRAELTGSALGLVHAGTLGLAGLYAESSATGVLVSALRYAGFGLLLAVPVALALQAVTRLVRPGRVAPVRGVLVAGWAALWALFLFKQTGEAGRGGLVGGIAALFVVAGALLFSRLEARAPRRGERPAFALAGVVVAALLLLPDPPVADLPAPADGTALEPWRPAAIAPFAPGGWNVLLLTFDTLRADHLGSYGYAAARSTALDSLARSGVQFANAVVQRPKTSPNVATFLTGTYPARHGIHRPMRRLPDRAETLAEVLATAGWTTGAVITNGNLYPEFAFDQGYAEYHYGHRDAKEGADLALDWLERHGASGEPWHLWVHATDPHWPYEPPEQWERHFADPGHDDRQRQIALYDGEIAWASEQTGRILAWLAARPRLRERTLVVFTADHGESLGEHDYSFEHGLHPYEPSARVPLVFSMPGRIPAGEHREAVVGSVDLVPTILDVVDVAVPDAVQGRSILPLVQGQRDHGPRDFVFLEAGYGEHIGPGRTRAVRTATTKYVRRLKEWALHPSLADLPWTIDAALEGGLAPDEYYDLAVDPAEVDSQPGDAGDLRARLDAFHAWLGEQVDPAGGDVELDPETEASLRSLGYIE